MASYPALVVFGLSALCCFAAVPGALYAQAPDSAATPPQPGFTLRTEARSVLTDVVVTDRDGKTVHGLPATAFHLFDDGRPQPMTSFAERSAKTETPVATPARAGVYSNGFLRNPPAASNIVLLDVTNMDLPDQMYLHFQLGKLIDSLTPGAAVAVYVRSGPAILLVQNFTADHALLAAAVRKAIPRLEPVGKDALTDIDLLEQLVLYLNQVPGRKNVLWFTGGSTLFLMADSAALGPNSAALGPNSATTGSSPQQGETAEQMDKLRHAYDELEACRIALYPIDARGLTVANSVHMGAQNALMQTEAEATGGHAYFNQSDLGQIAAKIVDQDSSFYTLAYAPGDFQYDHKWHKVRVTVDGGSYHLSYRQGYYADASGKGQEEEPGEQQRKLLLADGSPAAEPEAQRQPILFDAQVLPATAGAAEKAGTAEKAASGGHPKGTIPYSVHYLVPVDALTLAAVHGDEHATFGLAALMFNGNGVLVSRNLQQISLRVDPKQIERSPHGRLAVDQQIDLNKGDNYVYLAVWDMRSGRMGTLQVPVEGVGHGAK